VGVAFSVGATPFLFRGFLLSKKLTEEDRDRVVCSVSRAGMSLVMLCEETQDPVLSSKLNKILNDVRSANETLCQKQGDTDENWNDDEFWLYVN
jgi:hypothetical protein